MIRSSAKSKMSSSASTVPASTVPPAAVVGKGDQAASGAARRIRVSIVEDDDWIRNNLAEVLDEAPDLQCLSRFNCAETALATLPQEQPEVVLMDIGLPGMNGIECVRQLKTLAPAIQVLMLTVYGDSERVFAALLAGADGYLLKRSNPDGLLEAIRQVQRGESPMDGHIARQVVQYFRAKGAAPAPLEGLSRREHEVLEQLAKGAAYKQIAERLGISIETLRGYIKSVYHKLHVHSRGEAVAKYIAP
jgi:DNA-binding NarL/FixJ family response regulator